MFYKPLLAIILLCAVCCCLAQTSDQFSDSNFSVHPAWTGDDSLFKVNTALQLQSKGSSAKDICLSTPAAIASEMQWNCWAKFNVSPSTSNFCRYYLMSDTINLKGNVNGYYIQFGGVTGNNDSITLYKQKGALRTRIIGGRPATVSKTNNTIRVKVLRDSAGNWQLFSDTTGGYTFSPEGTGYDNEFNSTTCIGFWVRFTLSNASNYFFDDVYAGLPITDTLAPSVDSLTILSPTQLRLVFSESIEAKEALVTTHYTLNNAMDNPVSVNFESGTGNVIILTFKRSFTNTSYDLTVSGIPDIYSNILVQQKIQFTYDHYIVQKNDILISEFFPDPTPSIGLPEKEFIELYNNSDQKLNLEDWTISDGTTTATLPKIILAPDSFIIVCATASETDFAPFGKTALVTSLPSLNNTGDLIILKDATEKLIHQIQYDMSWYHDNKKQDGGFTIELMNPTQLCRQKQNYAASISQDGGTPGRLNSRWHTDADTSRPFIISAAVIDSLTLCIAFNEPMDSLSLLYSKVVMAQNTIMYKRVSSAKDTLLIQFSNNFQANKETPFSISGAADCSGNTILPSTQVFTYIVPAKAKQFDVVISEILANPKAGGPLPDAEYIEIYNRSSNIISLGNWSVSDVSSTARIPSCFLYPDSFLVLTSSANVSLFSIPNILGLSGFPSLGNDGDGLTLTNEEGKVIHHFIYTSAAYNDNIKKAGGWSLEMTDVFNPCGGNANLLASSNSNGGTPGYKNSVMHKNPDLTSPQLLKVYPLDANRLELRLNEQMDSLSLLPLQYYQSALLPDTPAAITLFSPDYTRIILSFNHVFDSQTIYRIMVDSVKDCSGNIISNQNYGDFGLPQNPDSGDIVINELLFDPRGNESDFVEIINRTDKMLDLKDLSIANTDELDRIKDFYPIDSTGWLLFPHAYAAITDNKISVMNSYFTPKPYQIIQSKLPTFPNDAGSCVLMTSSGNRLDQLNYSDDMHYALLDTKDGVSLERIDWNRSANDRSNWTSASSTCGFATPAYQNSQYAATGTTTNILSVMPEVFSPDGDGFNDHVTFSYDLPQSGYTGNLYIYNATGMLVKHLLQNAVLGASGSFGWDGITSQGNKAPIGIYLYYFEAFNMKGHVVQRKSTLVVSARL